jgi:glutathione S-transferase
MNARTAAVETPPSPPAMPLVLVSHALCPYVQRAAIVLAEKGLPFERREIDLADKPAWFLQVSPLGKTPVLLVDGEALFESAVICEYLDDTVSPPLHPPDALQRARHRAWMQVASELLNRIASFYTAADEPALQARTRDIRSSLERLEQTLGDGPYFAGDTFCMVDAAYGPVFRYLDVFDAIAGFDFLDGLPAVRRWRDALAARPSVAGAVRPDYPERLRSFLLARGSALSRRMTAAND